MKLRTFLSVVCIIFLSAALGLAVDTPQTDQFKDRLEQRTQKLKERLSLTDEQTAQVRTILQETQQQVQQDREQYKNDRRGMRQAVKKRTETMDTRIEGLLTAEQNKKYEQLKQERREFVQKKIAERNKK
jgi:Spy/CpxP family protein refolding chaperone